jgi:hypothetical protein
MGDLLEADFWPVSLRIGFCYEQRIDHFAEVKEAWRYEKRRAFPTSPYLRATDKGLTSRYSNTPLGTRHRPGQSEIS